MSLTNAAKKVIENYFYEMGDSKSFLEHRNWQIIHGIEKRFKLIGYSDYLERRYDTAKTERAVKILEMQYAANPDSDTLWELQQERKKLFDLKRN